MFAALRRVVSRWYVAAVLMAALGLAVGYASFFYVFSERPQVGVIDVPFTFLDQSTASSIGAMLDYADRTDSIKAVVLKLDTPGGSVASSEQLFLKVLRLREKKPVVVAAGALDASGGYLISVGANYIYATPSSFVGNVGVIFTVGRPSTPSERLITTGPAKRTGSTGRSFIRMVEIIKEHFVQTVIAQRGDRLSIDALELAEGRIYLGSEAVKLGLIDAIGTDSDAIERAADLAGLSHYGLVDVNEEVLRECISKVRRLLGSPKESDPQLQLPGITCSEGVLPSGDGARAAVAPDLPFDVSLPQMYYLYVTPPE